MYRNNYRTQTSGPSWNQGYSQSHYRPGSTSGLGQRMPLYPIGPTLTQPEFHPIQRGISPSPYIGKSAVRVPSSYENKYLPRNDSVSGHNNYSYEERQKMLIQRNQRQIQQQQKRRNHLRMSYQRQIKTLTAKLNRNQQKKQKLHSQIQQLQRDHQQLQQKLQNMKPPERTIGDHLQHIDRKQQEMIIMKNKLLSSMRQNQIQLNKKLEEEEKYWEIQIAQKQKYLFEVQQNLRQKRLQLHREAQKSLEKPDFLGIEEQIRLQKYNQFVQQCQDIQKKLRTLAQQKQKINKQLKDVLQLKRPQFHNENIKRQQSQRQYINLNLRVSQLKRVSVEMDAANQNLQKELERKQIIIKKCQEDISSLKYKKQQAQKEIHHLLDQARNRGSMPKSMADVLTRINQEIKEEQTKGSKLKNAYQKLYQLLCSSVSKNIHQTFNQTLLT